MILSKLTSRQNTSVEKLLLLGKASTVSWEDLQTAKRCQDKFEDFVEDLTADARNQGHKLPKKDLRNILDVFKLISEFEHKYVSKAATQVC
jgi:hypothetical protein